MSTDKPKPDKLDRTLRKAINQDYRNLDEIRKDRKELDYLFNLGFISYFETEQSRRLSATKSGEFFLANGGFTTDERDRQRSWKEWISIIIAALSLLISAIALTASLIGQGRPLGCP